MKRLELMRRVRSLTRDFSNSIFREQDIIDFLNEGINRCKQVVSEFDKMEELVANQQEVLFMPESYQHLLAIYSASRCFSQDERHYQATTLMNEFEIKLEELNAKIENGDIVIIDPETGLDVNDGKESAVDYVRLSPYFNLRSGRGDV